jgi:hypothetical protein
MKLTEAIWYGIFAINTYMRPDASSQDDIDSLAANEEEARTLLVSLARLFASGIVIELDRDRVESLLHGYQIGVTTDEDETLSPYLQIVMVPTHDPVICDRHGGPWGDDETCVQCTFESGEPRPLPHHEPFPEKENHRCAWPGCCGRCQAQERSQS